MVASTTILILNILSFRIFSLSNKKHIPNWINFGLTFKVVVNRKLGILSLMVFESWDFGSTNWISISIVGSFLQGLVWCHFSPNNAHIFMQVRICV